MTSRSEILRRLPAFNNEVKVLIKDQDTDDIIKAILKAHEAYKNDYDKICSLFYTGDEISTARNVFNYIKKNVKYVIESDDRQMIKSPSGIFSTPSSDCKNYALAINGIMDACRRKYGFDCDLYFRFAAYDGTNTPQHVFAVMNTDKGEIWIDPVLDEFNEDRQPNYYKDKKIKNMALMALSGIDPYENDQTALTRSVGAFTPPQPPKLTLAQGTGLNVAPLSTGGGLSNLLQNAGGINNILQSGIASSALSLLPGGAIVAQILPQLEKIFPNIKPTDPTKDPANTDYGRRMYLQMYPDVAASDVYGPNPFTHYATFGRKEGRYWFDNPSVTKEVVDDYLRRYPDLKTGDWGSSVLQHYIAYGQKEGRSIKLSLTPEQNAQIQQATSGYVSAGPIFPGGAPGATVETKKAGISPLIILALVGAGAAIFLSKKK